MFTCDFIMIIIDLQSRYDSEYDVNLIVWFVWIFASCIGNSRKHNTKDTTYGRHTVRLLSQNRDIVPFLIIATIIYGRNQSCNAALIIKNSWNLFTSELRIGLICKIKFFYNTSVASLGHSLRVVQKS